MEKLGIKKNIGSSEESTEITGDCISELRC